MNAIARAHVALLDEVLKELVVPALYRETFVNEMLVEERDYGAFKDKFDYGLPLRSAAFQCLQTLVEEAPHRLNLSDFVNNVRKGSLLFWPR